jgi:hypothetical protein
LEKSMLKPVFIRIYRPCVGHVLMVEDSRKSMKIYVLGVLPATIENLLPGYWRWDDHQLQTRGIDVIYLDMELWL